MTAARTAIIEDSYPTFLRTFFSKLYAGDKAKFPSWAVTALRQVGVDLLA